VIVVAAVVVVPVPTADVSFQALATSAEAAKTARVVKDFILATRVLEYEMRV